MKVNDVRFQCRGCGRFVKDTDIQHTTTRDDGAYYAVIEREWIDCSHCGPGQGVHVAVVGEYVLVFDPPLLEDERNSASYQGEDIRPQRVRVNGGNK